jgi:hypothetical protein
VAAYGGDGSNTASRSTPRSQVVNASGGSTNVALANNSGVRSAYLHPQISSHCDQQRVSWQELAITALLKTFLFRLLPLSSLGLR